MARVRKNRLMNRVFRNNLILAITPLVVVIVAMCCIMCQWRKSEFEREQILAAEKYAVRVSTAISDGIQKSKKIITWQYLINSLDVEDASNYDRLEMSNNINMFIDNATADNTADILIYTENEHIFQNKYINSSDKLRNYYEIKDEIRGNDNIFWDKGVYSDVSGQDYIKFYTGDTLHDSYILEYRIYIPRTETNYDIRVINSFESIEKDEIRREINGVFSVALNVDRKSLLDAISGIITIFVIFGIVFIGIFIFINYKTINESFKSMAVFIAGLDADEIIRRKPGIPLSKGDTEEIVVMKRALNALLRNTRIITERQRAIEEEKRKLEIHMLRKQIDPHMLYNSLSVIKLNAFRKNDSETMSLVDTMIEYYRAVLNKGNSFVSIKNEIDTIKKFLKIYESANAQRVDLYYEVSDSISNYMIPALLIHTFVENSVVHGFCGVEDVYRIIIICSDEGDSITISVEDNGCGIPEDKLGQLNSLDHAGYGIQNAVQRMRATFGEPVHVKFESELNKRTVVTINFNKCRNGEDSEYGE